MWFECFSLKVIIAYLNIHEVSSLQNKFKKKKYTLKRKMQEARK